MKKIIILLLAAALFLPAAPALAHCPLCTAGAAGAALIAMYFGVSATSIGIFLGAAALAMGLWIAKLVKKNYVPHQKKLLGAFSLVSTTLPLAPLMRQYGSIYVPFLGAYGTTYVINLFWAGVVIGSLLMLAAPWISGKLSKARGGKIFPFQGVSVALLLLITMSALVEILN